jgi:hypothetical protein
MEETATIAIEEPAHPELDRLHLIHEQSNAIGAFVDWLAQAKKVSFCVQHKHEESCKEPNPRLGGRWSGRYDCGLYSGDFQLFRYSLTQLLAEFFSIDLKRVEQEKQALLEYVIATRQGGSAAQSPEETPSPAPQSARPYPSR